MCVPRHTPSPAHARLQAKLRKGKASFDKAKAGADAAREEAEALRHQVHGLPALLTGQLGTLRTALLAPPA